MMLCRGVHSGVHGCGKTRGAAITGHVRFVRVSGHRETKLPGLPGAEAGTRRWQAAAFPRPYRNNFFGSMECLPSDDRMGKPFDSYRTRGERLACEVQLSR